MSPRPARRVCAPAECDSPVLGQTLAAACREANAAAAIASATMPAPAPIAPASSAEMTSPPPDETGAAKSSAVPMSAAREASAAV